MFSIFKNKNTTQAVKSLEEFQLKVSSKLTEDEQEELANLIAQI